MKTVEWSAVLLAALLLGGCDAGPALQGDPAAATGINPYPSGAEIPFFFRSASQWKQYEHADTKSAGVKPAD